MMTGKTIGHLPRPLGDNAAVARDGAAFVFGGGSGQDVSAEILRVGLEGRVEQVGALPVALRGHQVVSVGDAVFVLGGFVDGTRAEVWRLDPRDWTAKAVQPMPRDSAWFSATVLGRRIYVIGGFAIPHGYASDIAVYDVDRDRWDSVQDGIPDHVFPRGRIGGNATLGVGDRLLTFGGADEFDPEKTRANALGVCAEYHLSDQRWSSLAGPITAREGLVAVQHAGFAYLVGGMPATGEDPLAIVERVELATGRVEPFATLAVGVTTPAVAVVGHHLLVIGGVTQPPFAMTDQIEAFDLA